MDDLTKYNFQYSYNLINYKNVGHPWNAPYIIPVGETTVKLAPRLILSLGGTLQANAKSQEDSWEKTIQFFSQSPNTL